MHLTPYESRPSGRNMIFVAWSKTFGIKSFQTSRSLLRKRKQYISCLNIGFCIGFLPREQPWRGSNIPIWTCYSLQAMPPSTHDSIRPVGDEIVINHEASPGSVGRVSDDRIRKGQAIIPDPIFQFDEAIIPRTQLSIDESESVEPRSKLRILAVMTALFVSGNLVFLYNLIPRYGFLWYRGCLRVSHSMRLYHPRDDKLTHPLAFNQATVFIAALNQTIVATAIPTISAQLHSASGYAWM